MIVLVGFMGAGKTTVGRLLSGQLGLPFIDADAVIAVRFDSSEIGQQFTEIVAYGTAVKLAPLS